MSRAHHTPVVLVVDDKEANRTLLAEYLGSCGYGVRLASGGREALDLAFRHRPDVVLLDVMMPDLTGYEVCRILKNDDRTRLAQVMMVTALGASGHQVEGLDCGADDYIAKPVRKDEFLARVRSLLRARGLLQELDDARNELSERNASLEELHELKDTLSQTLVHDLKNPLTALLGNLELLSRRIDEAQAGRLRACRDQADRMHRMLLDLLDVAGLEEHRMVLHRSAVDPFALATEVRAGMEGLGASRDITVTIEPCEDSAPVYGDASVLARVLDNLLANAVAHSPVGGTVRVAIQSCAEGVGISVSDEGPGVPESHRETIFDKFARVDDSGSASSNRGLGLTFCRLAIEAHGGAIWVEDAPDPDSGARFRILLPVDEGAEDGLEDGVARRTGVRDDGAAPAATA